MTTLIQRSFSGGEIAPAIQTKVDFVKYQTGVKTARNVTVMRHGGLTNRCGTRFIGETKLRSTSGNVRLIPFLHLENDSTVYSSFGSANYFLEFGHEYFRPYQLGYPITETVTAVTQVIKGAVTTIRSNSHGLVNGDQVIFYGLNSMPELMNRHFTVGSASTNTFVILDKDGSNIDSGAFEDITFQAYPSFPTTGPTVCRLVTVATPYSYLHLKDLSYAQSIDVMTICHPVYAVRKITFTSSFAMALVTFSPAISAPVTPASGTPATAGAATYSYQVTAIAAETYEESLPLTITVTLADPTINSTNTISLSWTAPVTGTPIEYNIYRALNGVYGFIGVAGLARTYLDLGTVPDVTETPPITRNPFSGANLYPSTVAYVKQRQVFANSFTYPETTWCSKIGQYNNFTISSPLQDDDAVTFQMSGDAINPVRHVVDLGGLVELTDNGEWAIPGSSDGVLTPTAINPKEHTRNGASNLRPIKADGDLLYVQANGTVRSLAFTFQTDGYRGNELSAFAPHLIDDYEITDWAYQKLPGSIVWCVRDDGKAISLTFIKEQEIIGWSRHDTDGVIESVCAVPEGKETTIYLVVKREIGGVERRYIERMASKNIKSDDYAPNDYARLASGGFQVPDGYAREYRARLGRIFSDASITHDGRNAKNYISEQTVTITGGSTWVENESVTLTHVIVSAPISGAETPLYNTNVGDVIRIYDEDDVSVDILLTGFTSQSITTTAFTGKILYKTVPTSLRSVATSVWTRCVDEVHGLWHLEGKDVSVLADGYVLASPYNPDYETLTVENGAISLDRHYGVIHVGLPYLSDIETLDIDTAQGETISNKNKLVSKVEISVEDTRGVWVGGMPPSDDDTDALEGLNEFKVREEEDYGTPITPKTGKMEVILDSAWNSNGRVFIRQVDPLPMTVLAVSPDGLFPFRGK